MASSSITIAGGTRPPAPMTIGAGRALPDDTGMIVNGATISVIVKLALAARNSETRPLTRTRSPTLTSAAGFDDDPVKTKIPSDVAASTSGFGSWR